MTEIERVVINYVPILHDGRLFVPYCHDPREDCPGLKEDCVGYGCDSFRLIELSEETKAHPNGHPFNGTKLQRILSFKKKEKKVLRIKQNGHRPKSIPFCIYVTHPGHCETDGKCVYYSCRHYHQLPTGQEERDTRESLEKLLDLTPTQMTI